MVAEHVMLLLLTYFSYSSSDLLSIYFWLLHGCADMPMWSFWRWKQFKMPFSSVNRSYITVPSRLLFLLDILLCIHYAWDEQPAIISWSIVKGRKTLISQLVCDWTIFLSSLFALFLWDLYFGVIVNIDVKFGRRTILLITGNTRTLNFSQFKFWLIFW